MADLVLQRSATSLRVERQASGATLVFVQEGQPERFFALSAPMVGQLMAYLGRWDGSDESA